MRSPNSPGARWIALDPFDIQGSLPEEGVTLLEASAGTGKTFTIAGLFARFVAEKGVPVNRILAVTFTRLATAELRGRIRDRLVRGERRLSALIGDLGSLGHTSGHRAALSVPEQIGSEDDVVDLVLANGKPEALRGRRELLARALSQFDAASITTTHGFCHLVLASLGVAGRVQRDARLTEDPGDLVEQVVDDLYVRWSLRHEEKLDYAKAKAAAVAAVAHIDAQLIGGPPGSESDLRRRLASAARDELDRRLSEANLLTYDKLLVELSKALTESEGVTSAAAVLRDRYDVVLVDEFQDTDPIQWRIVKDAFAVPGKTLVLIGDPKQAIYAFRGGDVYAYLEATSMSSKRFTLTWNRRSDGPLVEALGTLLEGVELGHPEIRCRAVRVPEPHLSSGLDGAPVQAPLRIRILDTRAVSASEQTKFGLAKAFAERCTAVDVASDLIGLLESGATLPSRTGLDRRRIEPGDIAVLVRTNHQARLISATLLDQGVPAVASGGETVFSSPSASHWLRLLEALEQPSSPSKAAAVALTPFFGIKAAELAELTQERWEALHSRLYDWAEVLRHHGVAALYRRALEEEEVPARVLAVVGGARIMTDLGHLAQLLHAQNAAESSGLSGLRAWLKRRMVAQGFEGVGEERVRRLESDADAVQVLTVHRAKGLEFPVVYCPYLWCCPPDPGKNQPALFHDPHSGAPGDHPMRSLDVGPDETHREMALSEVRGEDLRLLYVALTRARHQVVLWWAETKGSENSSLSRVIMARHPDGSIPPSTPRRYKIEEVHQKLLGIAASSHGNIAIEICRPEAQRTDRGETLTASQGGTLGSEALGSQPDGDETSHAGELDVAIFGRRMDRAWRRTSYSAMVAARLGDQEEQVASEPEPPEGEIRLADDFDEPETLVDFPLAEAGDEPAPGSLPSVDATTEQIPQNLLEIDSGLEAALRAEALPLGDLPGGVAVGTFLHRILEQIDFACEDLGAEVTSVLEAQWHRRPERLDDLGALALGLAAVIETPLGPLVEGIRLRDIGKGDRLTELGFELPLAGGDSPRGAITLTEIARLLEPHIQPPSPLAGYAGRLAELGSGSGFRGYLTGSLDLVFRRPGELPPGVLPSSDRYYLVDYKTNRLTYSGEPLSAWHYRPEALAVAMQAAHYPLQALLYLVALHRYLRWRVPGYDPATNLGGVLYLFVRGMTGAASPLVGSQPCGVFSWRPPGDLVAQVSDLFDCGESGG